MQENLSISSSSSVTSEKPSVLCKVPCVQDGGEDKDACGVTALGAKYTGKNLNNRQASRPFAS